MMSLRTWAAAALLFAAVPLHAQNLPTDFYVENIAPGATFNTPVVLAFAPDGRIFVGEKSGVVWVVQNGAKQGTPFIDLSADVLNQHDRGLLGMEFDPNFANNRRIYFLYTFDWNGGGDYQRKDVTGRLVRYQADASNPNVADLSTRVVLLGANFTAGIPSCYYSHAPGDIHFGSDGTLLVAAGDGASYSEQDPGGLYPECFGPGKLDSSQDIGAFRSQWIGSMAGKILRVDPNTGNGLPSNPFYNGDPTAIESKVWCYGLRNPYRFGVRPNGSINPNDGNPGSLYIGDVGWNAWEELNISSSGGENFGWPCYEGPNPHSGYQSETPAHHACSTIGTPANPSLPIPGATYWQHGGGTGSFPAGVTGATAIGGDFYEGSKYPVSYVGKFFYADYSGEWMKVMDVDGADNYLTQSNFGTNMGGVVELRYDPYSQYMYYIDIFAGKAYRIRHTQGDANGAPIIVATVSPQWGYAPLPVQFTASGSYDPNGDSITFEWDFGDGGMSAAADTQYTYTANGDYTATLTVRDEFGVSTTEQFSVAVGNTPPSATLLLPGNGEFFSIGDVVTLAGSAVDAEDPEPSLTYEWEVTQGHQDHTHPNFFTATGKAAQFTVVEHGLPDEVNFLAARLTVTDPGGLSDVHTHYIVLNRENETDVTDAGTPIALITAPTGSGNPDIGVIKDGVFPVTGSSDPLQQYDTYDGGGPRPLDWIGYSFPDVRYFSRVILDEGIQSSAGGYFDSLWVEVRIDGVWERVDYQHALPPYEGDNGINYSFYAITFEAQAGDAIRVVGVPGGTDHFISVGELRVFEIPRAEFVADVRTGTNPLAVTFTDLSIVTNPVSWLWTFGDGNTSTEATPTHIYTVPGPHTVSLSVTGDEGTFFEEKDNYIFVGTPGLLGEYYDDADFSGPLLSRIDPDVDFDWGTSAPDPTMGADTFSVRWRGWVRPRYSGPLTFHATTDDGVRLWVNNVLLIDQWQTQGTTEYTGSTTLVGDELYTLRMEYFDDTGSAEAHLEWSSASQAREVIPQSRLFAKECAQGLGDVNADGSLTPGDALCALQTYLNGQIPTAACNIADFDCEVVAADADCSGTVTPGDALSIYEGYLAAIPLSPCFAQGGSPVAPRYETRVIERTVLGTAGQDDIIEVTFTVEDPVAFDAFGVTIHFTPQNVRFEGIERAPATDGWVEIAASQTEAGAVRIGGFDATGLSRVGSTPIFRAVFSAPDVSDTSPIVFSDFVDDLSGAWINEGGSNGGDTPVPGAFRLHQNYPNPFNPETIIRFDVPSGSTVHTRLVIYGVSGEVVRVLVNDDRPPGFYEARWDGRNNSGTPVTSGVYFYTLEAGGYRDSKRMVLLK